MKYRVRGDQERSIHTQEIASSIKSNHDTDSPTSGREAKSMFYIIAASKRWKIYSADIPEAFFQGSKKMKMQIVEMDAPKGAGLKHNLVWKPLMQVYGF